MSRYNITAACVWSVGIVNATAAASLGCPAGSTVLASLDWTDFTLQDFRDTLNCRDLFSRPRPIHEELTWQFLRRTYLDVVGAEKSSVERSLLEAEEYEDGFAVPYRVSYSSGKGRGIFAQEDIEESNDVWRPQYTAVFKHGNDFREYLASLPTDLACDVIEWSYAYRYLVDKDGENEEMVVVCTDLDPASFCNDGSRLGHQNINYSENATQIVAARKIKAGEELLCDYNSFFYYEGWSKLGL